MYNAVHTTRDDTAFIITWVLGSECLEKFQKMSECMAEYPDLYPDNNDDEEKKADTDKDETTSNDNSTDSNDKTKVTDSS